MRDYVSLKEIVLLQGTTTERHLSRRQGLVNPHPSKGPWTSVMPFTSYAGRPWREHEIRLPSRERRRCRPGCGHSTGGRRWHSDTSTR